MIMKIMPRDSVDEREAVVKTMIFYITVMVSGQQTEVTIEKKGNLHDHSVPVDGNI